MGEKMRAKKGDKNEKQREEAIELEKDEKEIQKAKKKKKKKDKIVDSDRKADIVAEVLKTTCVEGEENVSEKTNGLKDLVNSMEEKKEKKKKHKEEEKKKKRKEGVYGISSLGENIEDDKVDELVEGRRHNKNGHKNNIVNTEVEQAEKKKKKKKKKKEEEEGVDGISSLGENVEVEKIDELVKDCGNKSQDNLGVNSKVEEGEKKKKKKKKKEGADGISPFGENVVDDNVDELVKGQRNNKNFQDIPAVNSEVERTEKKKKRKRENEDGDDVVKNIVTNVQKLSKEEKHTDSKINEGSKLAVKDKMGAVAKAQKDTESRDVAEMNDDKEGGNRKKKKKRKMENASGDVEETIADKLGTESTRIQDDEKEGYEDSVRSTEDTLHEDCSNAVYAKDAYEGKKKAKSAKLGKGDDCNKYKKKKVELEKQVLDGKGQKRKRRTKIDSDTTNTSENPTPRGKSKRVSFSNDVAVLSSYGLTWKESKQAKGLVRGKRFTPEEDRKVKEAVFGYIEERGLGDDGLDMVLNCKSHPEVRYCWNSIAASLPWRPVGSVYYRAHILFERGENRKWTPEQYEYVLKYYKEHGSKWKKLSELLKKSKFQVRDTFRRIKFANLSKGRWSQEEYRNLFDLVNMDLRMRAYEEKKSKHGMLRDNISWSAISERLSSRNHFACCMKWYKQLTSSMVAEGLWADSDDYRLINALSDLDAVCIEDVDWDNLLEHREGDICRKRWKQMVKHIGDYANMSFSEQVEVLSKRYSVDVLEAREIYDKKEPIDC